MKIKFFLKINDVHSLKPQCSSEIIVRGIRWKIAVSKDRINSIDYIGVYLMTQANDLAVDVARDFTLLSPLKWFHKNDQQQSQKSIATLCAGIV